MMNNRYFDFDLFDDVFDPFFSPRRPSHAGRALQAPVKHPMPAMPSMRTDIQKTENGYELTTELAGYSRDDITAEIKNGYLKITAEKKTDSEDKKDENGYVHRERFYGKCTRSFYVGNSVNEDDITASFSDGILKLMIPEPKEQQKKTITIA